MDDRFEEMRELSRFIHDTIAQDLVKISFFLHELEEDAVHSPAPAGIDLKAAKELVNRCCADIRTVTSILAPVVHEDLPLYTTIEHYVDCFRNETGMAATVDLDPLPPLPPDVERLFGYVLQVWLAKAVRSHRSASVLVRLRDQARCASLELEIQRGSGIIAPESFQGGWAAARRQVAALGGEFNVFSDSDSVRCRLTVPTGF